MQTETENVINSGEWLPVELHRRKALSEFKVVPCTPP